ncbi:MAG: MraY family glycosyltransferase [Pseudomonadota bacterium]
MAWQVWLLSAALAAISFAVALVACRAVMKLKVVDAPDGARKTQTHAVPRLGGVAIFAGAVLGGCVGLFVLAVAYGISPVQVIVIHWQEMSAGDATLLLALAFTATAFLIGLWDDLQTANTKAKLVMFAVVCIAVTALGLTPAALPTPWGEIASPGLMIAGSALWLLVFTNAANFMDGSNGLAIGSIAIMLAALAMTGIAAGAFVFSVWWFPVCGAVAGFMTHNLRGQLYAGDAGALALGGLFASLGLMAGLEVWTVATFALPFLIDVLLTLAWRTKHGRNLLDAHLDHSYQCLIDSGWSHFEAALLYWGLSATAGVLAYIGAQAGGAAPFLIFWTLTGAGTLLWLIHRRTAKRNNLAH